MMVPALFTPFRLREATFRNRIVVSPMCQYLAVDGTPGAWHMAHHARFALGGVGCGIVEATAVTREGRITPGCTGLYKDEHVAGWAAVTDLYHAHGALCGVQIGHSGGKGSTARPWEGAAQLPPGGTETPWEIIAASAVAMRPGWAPPRPATVPEIEEIVHAFGQAARRAVAAGFDFIELHGAHGYLLHTFFSPVTNRRDDAFGGSREKRMRLACLVAEEVRRSIPSGMPLLYRASVVDHAEGGNEIADTVALAQALKARGVDLIDCSAGGVGQPVSLMTQTVKEGFQIPLADGVKSGAGIPTMAVGMITDPRAANAAIAEGKCDFVALARELIADPNWAYRAAIELDHPAPESVLPLPYGFYLERRAQAQGRAKRQASPPSTATN